MDHNDKVHSISEFVSSFIGKLGIVSLEVGTIQESTGKWTTVEGYCAKDLTALHTSASTEFSHEYSNQYGDNQPINYIYEYWRNKQDRTEEIVYYSFGCNGFIGSSDDSSVKNILAAEDEPHQYELITRNDIVENIHSGEASRNNTSKDSSTDFLEVFKKSQAEFTAIVLKIFNKVLKEDAKIKYVTIVLFRTKYDEKWHLSYNAAIFSDNLCYLKIPEFNLLFDYISRGNYLNEIRHLKHTVQKEAIKSAVSAVMSRNMSHNLGSHFISNTKNYFDALIDRTQNNAPVYRGVKFALQYIQERMDFIATVTSDDKYPFGVVNAKAQIFDELTPDDLGARHQKQSLNFLMDYLVLSEKISKRSYDLAGTTSLLSKGTHVLKLLMGYEKEDGTVEFWNSEKADDISRRDYLVNINFAIPGGILGRHAVFSIIENVIRNAAKHGQDKIGDEFVIRLLCTKDNHLVIYDNKCDQQIRKTVESLTERMHNLRMLNPDNSLNQDNKGLKEILICAAWLQNTSISDVLQNKNFDDYVRIMAVNNEGKELPSSAPDGYLAYSIHLDRFEKSVYLNCTPSIDSIKSIKADIICADKDYQVEGTNTSLSKMVPRFLIIPSEEYKQIVDAHQEAELLRRVVERNCKITAQNVQMVCSSDEKRHIINGNEGPIVAFENYVEKSADDFLFKGHAGKSKWSKFESLFLTHGFETKYVDAISGGDFTHTLVQPSFVVDLYNLYKIFESVKTRFVIIDERIFEQYRSKKPSNQRQEMLDTLAKRGFPPEDVVNTAFLEEVVDKAFLPTILCDSINKEVPKDNRRQLLDFVSDKQRFLSFCKKDIEQHYLERKNIHVLSFDSMENGTYELKDLSYNCYGHFEMDNGKVSFRANNGCHYFTDAENAPITFLSIHLGLIDKVKGRMNGIFDESEIVETLKEYFGDNIFVSIHSGRGGYDVRDALKKYVFQSYSAIENPLHNSKFLLAQQFYNLSYHG